MVGFFAMLRKSNLVPDAIKSFDPTKQLTRSHVEFREEIAVLAITWAKNIQFKQKIMEIPLFKILGSPLCPVMVLKALLHKSGCNRYPLFR